MEGSFKLQDCDRRIHDTFNFTQELTGTHQPKDKGRDRHTHSLVVVQQPKPNEHKHHPSSRAALLCVRCLSCLCLCPARGNGVTQRLLPRSASRAPSGCLRSCPACCAACPCPVWRGQRPGRGGTREGSPTNVNLYKRRKAGLVPLPGCTAVMVMGCTCNANV